MKRESKIMEKENRTDNSAQIGLLKQIALMIIDMAFFFFVNCCICYLTMGGHINATGYSHILFNYVHFMVTTVILMFIHNILGLYKSVWTFAGTDEVVRSFVAAFCDSLLLYVTDRLLFVYIIKVNGSHIPYYAYIVCFVLVFFAIMIPRIGYRTLRHSIHGITKGLKPTGKVRRTMIIGAGFMGNFIIDDLRNSGYTAGYPVVVIDDNPSKKNKRLNGLKIAGNCDDMARIAEDYDIDQIIICIPSATDKRQREIISMAMKTEAEVKISPSMSEFLEKGKSRGMRKVEITDLLPRPEVKLDIKICRYLIGKTILVTGGGGSIGSEICNQVARYNPLAIIIFDIYENCAYELQTSLRRKYGNAINIEVRIGSVRDVDRLREVFEEFHPDVVFHAAAHKHVPLMEDSPCEAVKNNVFGTLNTAKVVSEFKVPRMVILSTDKAVNPTNVMGATKRITEIIIQYMNEICPTTVFAAVRFGNVLGSHGSVIPLFKQQIESGGPVCVTHPDITRYFMTIPEAAQLVCQAGGLAKGGEVFVLDMGEPVRIMDLAQNLIRLSGYTQSEIPIKITGLRPGEKLYEELAMESEMSTREKTANEKIYVTHPVKITTQRIEAMLDDLKDINNDNVRDIIEHHVPTYHPEKAGE